MSTCDERTDDFGVDDRLDGGELDESIWIACFLPQPARISNCSSAPNMTGGCPTSKATCGSRRSRSTR